MGSACLPMAARIPKVLSRIGGRAVRVPVGPVRVLGHEEPDGNEATGQTDQDRPRSSPSVHAGPRFGLTTRCQTFRTEGRDDWFLRKPILGVVDSIRPAAAERVTSSLRKARVPGVSSRRRSPESINKVLASSTALRWAIGLLHPVLQNQVRPTMDSPPH